MPASQKIMWKNIEERKRKKKNQSIRSEKKKKVGYMNYISQGPEIYLIDALGIANRFE